jgi:hypothetical protein
VKKKQSKKKLLKRRKYRPKKNGNGHRIVILAKLKKAFNVIDAKESRGDWKYVDETNRLFDLLMQEFPYEPEDPKDRAIYDIVIDIFKACGKEAE